ncbi:MAG: orotidine-5'-phosphate decarboxylase [Chloroflexi bacterium]|nr:orotidine-5'-phosphate decarboxylase [Chloroflexota bacterium]
MNFFTKLEKAAAKNNSRLCIGLDPHPDKMPKGVTVAQFNRGIIEATSDLVCAYKPNLAFYEALGAEGYAALKDTISAIPPGIPAIADAKRGDIGSTAAAYAKSIFEELGCSGVTVNPYMGYDSLKPFLDYKEKGVFILCRTSNPGSEDFQTLKLEGEENRSLYQLVAHKASKEWNVNGNIGLVVGATYPQEIKLLRQRYPDLPLLIPGVGAQGGDLEAVVRYGADSRGGGIIINSSRQILYASNEKDFAWAARKAAIALRDSINLSRS